ncbi:hypothetical protein NP233_g3280 [Leucocoprinus birnbaumii]|uniref:Nephrocystin 3-like N-terminal domain-containing protein n=1 Tax=Leucocoprinus birnbaumii TaxID=56174 RepID=A0AAD5VZF0_9AGAR|nr:hypothetical protein NP233_g3280 [Leucocoprinus birnbaumii]
MWSCIKLLLLRIWPTRKTPVEDLASCQSPSEPPITPNRMHEHTNEPANIMTPLPSPGYLNSPHPSGFLTNAQNIVIHNPVMFETINGTNDEFMKEFSAHTIQGAELDSSARDPPPRCHPATRLEIIDRMRLRLRKPTRRVQWLVGPAGVGKSAIMQTVAELEQNDSALLSALFFSAPNGRNDPTKVIATLAYQIALRHEGYRNYLRSKVKADPKLWTKSIDAHFAEFIVEPLAKHELCSESVLIFIDGLDECHGQREQIRFLSLIRKLTVDYPHTPLQWVIASRPEAHITAHMDQFSFYEKEEVSVDSPEACQDVERFLRAEFGKIRKSDTVITSLYRQWPPEDQLLKLLAAALGLFAYADTAVRFIGDLAAGDPITRFGIIINLVTNPVRTTSTSHDTSSDQPMANLDTLYRYLISQISRDNLPRVEEILAYVIFSPTISRWYLADRTTCFMCNWIGISANVMYGALRQLHSVLSVPQPRNADEEQQKIRFYHKSFSDFLLNTKKSGISLGTLDDEWHRSFVRSSRILSDISYSPATSDLAFRIALSWPLSDNYALQGRLHNSASSFFREMSAFPDIPDPQIVHALQVLYPLPKSDALEVSKYVLRLLFHETHAQLAQMLRSDKALLEVRITILDTELIRDRKLAICIDDRPTTTQDHWLSPELDETRKHKYLEHHEKLVYLLEQAQNDSPRGLVKVFLPSHPVGIVQFRPSPQVGVVLTPQVYYFYYDFTALYESLKGQKVGETTN